MMEYLKQTKNGEEIVSGIERYSSPVTWIKYQMKNETLNEQTQWADTK